MQLLSLYPEAGDLSGVEMISFHEKDNVAYLDDCIICVYKDYPTPEVLDRFGGDPDGDYLDYFIQEENRGFTFDLKCLILIL